LPLKQFRLYLDECGTEDYACVDEPSGRYLSLVGVIMEHREAVPATANLQTIKEKFFTRHPDDPPVIFHRTDIVKYRGAFQALRDDDTRATFDRWWMHYLTVTPYEVICVVIDKRAMQRKETWRIKHPYHYAMSVLVEKYALFLGLRGGHGDIMPESRGAKKDAALQAAFDKVREDGTFYVGRGLVQERLPAKALKFRVKADNVTGLQICDSLAKPAQDFVLLRRREIQKTSPFSRSIQGLLEDQKFYCSDPSARRIWGYGVKFLP
jgi:hypothetical protein